MRGYLLLISCLMAVVAFVTLTEGKPMAAADNKHKSKENVEEQEEQNVEDLSGSGSGSGAGTFRRHILQ